MHTKLPKQSRSFIAHHNTLTNEQHINQTHSKKYKKTPNYLRDRVPACVDNRTAAEFTIAILSMQLDEAELYVRIQRCPTVLNGSLPALRKAVPALVLELIWRQPHAIGANARAATSRAYLLHMKLASRIAARHGQYVWNAGREQSGAKFLAHTKASAFAVGRLSSCR